MKSTSFRGIRGAVVAAISLIVLLFAGCQMDPSDQALSREVSSAAAVVASSVDLGSASTFAVMGYAGVTNVGASVITGDLGVGPGAASATGFNLTPGVNRIEGPGILGVTDGLGVVTGTIYAGGPVAEQAQADAQAAYNYLVAQVPGTILGDVYQLDGVTFTPGIYKFPSSANLQVNGTLTLNFQGDPNALFIFQLGSTLVTMAGSNVVAINTGSSSSAGVSRCATCPPTEPPVDPPSGTCVGANVYWAVGSAATIDGETFIGTVIATSAITMAAETDVFGRLFALVGSVTFAAPTNVSACAGSGGGGTVPPTPECKDWVTGKGWIDGQYDGKGHKKSHKNDKANFDFSAGVKNGEAWGRLSYEDDGAKDKRGHKDRRGMDGIKVRSTGVTAYTIIDEVTRQIEGTARVNGRESVTYKLVVVDNGERGRRHGGSSDTFSLELSNGYSVSGTLEGGNIRIHQSCKPSRDHEHDSDCDHDYDDKGWWD